MTSSTDRSLIQRAEAHYSEDQGESILLKIGKRYTIREEPHNVVLHDTRYPNYPAYFTTMSQVLAEVFERQVKARISEDSRKNLEALRDAILDTRAELRAILSIHEGIHKGVRE